MRRRLRDVGDAKPVLGIGAQCGCAGRSFRSARRGEEKRSEPAASVGIKEAFVQPLGKGSESSGLTIPFPRPCGGVGLPGHK